ncbi:GNAT family N-acetyltransferase [Aureimonas sp. Leaf324]|uniref:GNAT family N-acetyltransferase n=1 Tax=Aureimonas sp. Leaf324 TaxID=1736336 RepID=UPI0006F80FBC|nr:GNAT family N-acetyltransferase [Aureimonas sp. Leaf324]KQQ88695.1 hypothetical protein ASF65_17890 [Aureimonas sp. Leaf324]
MEAIRLRDLRPDDIDGLADIWHASASLPGVGPAALPSPEAMRWRFEHELMPACRIIVAEQGGEPVGFAAMKLGERVLDQLFVRPGFLGGGVGRSLLDAVKREMPDGFTLFTRPTNPRACRFYEAAGLRLLRHETHPRFGDPIVVYGWQPAA